MTEQGKIPEEGDNDRTGGQWQSRGTMTEQGTMTAGRKMQERGKKRQNWGKCQSRGTMTEQGIKYKSRGTMIGVGVGEQRQSRATMTDQRNNDSGGVGQRQIRGTVTEWGDKDRSEVSDSWGGGGGGRQIRGQ